MSTIGILAGVHVADIGPFLCGQGGSYPVVTDAFKRKLSLAALISAMLGRVYFTFMMIYL